MTQDLDELLQVDWSLAAKQAVVYSRDGAATVPTADVVDEQAIEDRGAQQPIFEAEVRTAGQAFHVPIGRITEKVGKPVIHRASLNIKNVQEQQEIANRLREEAEAAKAERITHEFLLTPQGKRIVRLEESLAAALERIAYLEQQQEQIDTRKAATRKTTPKKEEEK